MDHGANGEVRCYISSNVLPMSPNGNIYIFSGVALQSEISKQLGNCPNSLCATTRLWRRCRSWQQRRLHRLRWEESREQMRTAFRLSLLCKHWSKSNTQLSTMLRYANPERCIWFMCETFYGENNQQYLNLLCFGWMISRFHRWFVIRSGTDKHLIQLIWMDFINSVSERIYSGGSAPFCVDSVSTMRRCLNWNANFHEKQSRGEVDLSE